MKRLLVLLLVLTMIIPTCAPAFAAENEGITDETVAVADEMAAAADETTVNTSSDPEATTDGQEVQEEIEETEKIPQIRQVVAHLSDAVSIAKTGLKASTERTKSGSFTALVEGEALTKNTTIPVNTSDFTGGAHLEVSIFSPGATDTTVAFVLMSDNPATKVKDYYFTVQKCKFQGWKVISVPYEEMETNGSPMGFDSIDSIEFVPGYGASIVDPGARLFLDDIAIVNVPSYNANVEVEIVEQKLEPLVVWTAEENGASLGEVVEIGGKKGLKWGPGKDELINGGPGTIYTNENWDLGRYKELVVEMYSVKNTDSTFCFTAYNYALNNPDTPAVDWYWSKFPINWEGEWKEIRVMIQGGDGNDGGFSNSHDPLFDPYEAEFFSVGGQSPHGDVFVESTEVYVSKIYFDGDANAVDELNPNGDLIYASNFDPETMVDYVAMVKEKHPRKGHPRLLVTDDILKRIKKYKDTDPFVKAAYEAVKGQADKYLTEDPPPPTKIMGVSGSLAFDRNHLEDVTEACGLMYLLTGDKRYPERIWIELQTIMEVDHDWVSAANGTGLDSGHLTNAMALAYDWCYDYWTDEQKQYIRNGTMKYALYATQLIRNGGGFLYMGNNTVPAIAKGYVTACLAWCDEPGYSDFCNDFLNNLIKYFSQAFYFQYEPDGMYSEGIGYWWYATTGTAYFLTAMDTAIGSDGGLSENVGFSKAINTPFAVRGPKGAFDFSDSTKTSLQYGTPVYFYLDEKYGVPAARAYRISTYEKAGDLEMLDLIWYNPELKTDNDWRSTLTKDYILGGLEPLVSLRSSYEPEGYFIAGKGGNSRTGHDQFDAGSFVIDALGVRWIEDTGAEVYEYDTPSYWRYRERPEGNNCLFVDPTREWKEGAGQTVGLNRYDTMSTIVDSGSADGAAYGIVDNAPSYQETLSEYSRGFALVNNRTQFIIRDEFETLEPYELYSYYHTTRGISITPIEGTNSFMMETKDGKKCRVDFVSDIKDFEVGVMDAVAHPSSPKPGPNNVPHADNSGFHKLYFHTNSVTKGSITVVFTPMLSEDDVVLPEILPFSEWSKYLENPTALTSLSLDGVPLVEFNPGVGTYNVESEKIGTVAATASDDVVLEITQATKIGETATIKATSKTTGKSFTYKVNFMPFTIPGITTGIEHVSLTADYIPEPHNPPANMFDGNLGTRFAADATEGEVLFTMDLGKPNSLNGFSISFYNGHTRKNKFAIEVSMDNENWVRVFDGFTSGNTDELVAFEFENTDAQYVRFCGYGCYGEDEQTLVNSFNSITEFAIYGDALDFDDTKGHWAQSEIYFARNYGLVEGVGENIYMPENSVTRAEFITMIARACNLGERTYEDGTFADVNSTDWFSTAVMAANEKGIIPSEMIADGNFYPNAPLTREEMCAIAVNAFSASTYREAGAAGTISIFADIEDGAYTRYIDQAIGLRIVNGMTANTFAPKANITRAQAAAILRRVFLKIFNVNN